MSKHNRGNAKTAPTRAQRRPIGARAALLLVVIVAAACVWFAFAPPAGSNTPPNILLISVDTLRPDHLGCYAYATARTPNIDRLAREGVVFDAARSPIPITLPAHASMLCGQLPTTHGARLNVGYRLPDEVETLAEVLHQAGYQTGGFVGGLPVARQSGLAQGFDHYDDQLAQLGLGNSAIKPRQERFAGDVCSAALAWLQTTDPEKPTFTFVHLYDPHAPYVKPDPTSGQPSYDGEIAYVDQAIGTLLKTLEGDARWANTLLVFTSDHGESLGQHREQTHGVFIYETTLRVPLIVHWPQRLEPGRVATPACLVDIAPTVLELAGVRSLKNIDGQSLAGALRNASPTPVDRALYFESLLGRLEYGWAPLRGVVIGNLKYIDAPRAELYDLVADPQEQTNLLETRAADAARLQKELAKFGTGIKANAEPQQDTRAQLEALGYVGAPPVEDDAADTDRPDPKDCIEVYDRFQQVHTDFALGRTDEALATLAQLEPYFERSPYFYYRWGTFAAQVQKWPTATTAYVKCLALDPHNEKARLNLGVAYLELGRPAESLLQFDTLLQDKPDHVEALLYAGEVCNRYLKRPDDAVRHWEHFLAVAPDHPSSDKIRKVIQSLNAAAQP